MFVMLFFIQRNKGEEEEEEEGMERGSLISSIIQVAR